MPDEKQILYARDEVNKFVDRELEGFFAAMESKPDLVINVLRIHLVMENTLERLILGSFKRGDRLIEKGGLSFAQKLTVVEAMDVLPDAHVQALRHLNAVRNDCAHQRGKQITAADIERIGRPLGKVFTRLRHDCGNDLPKFLHHVLSEVFKGVLNALAPIELRDFITPSDSASVAAPKQLPSAAGV